MRLTDNPACNPACRACHYKDLEYEEQLARKREWAERQLGRWSEVLREIVPAPESERIGYRAKSWLRTNATPDDVSFGMFRAVRGETRWEKEFISWNTCPIHTPAIQATLGRLRSALETYAPEFAANSLFGVWFGTPHVVLVAKDRRAVELAKLPWPEILEAPLTDVGFHQTNQVGRSTFGEGPVVSLFSSADPKGPKSPIRAFRQIARTLLDQARAGAVKALVHESPDLIFDLYCGTGELARLIPEATGWIGIESSKEAVAYASELRTDGPVAHKAFLGLMEHRLGDMRVTNHLPDQYALYLNPPRPGLGEATRPVLIDLIRHRRPTSVVYLSCSASSLARDLEAITAEGFHVESLQPYDFFPQTEHFETLAVLR